MAGRQPSALPSKNVLVHAREQSDSQIDIPEDTINPFADPVVAERYALIYEKAQYECRHVFDPSLTWTAEEERALVWKLDLRVCFWAVCTTYLFFTTLECLVMINSVLCSSASKSIEGISSRPCRITYWMIWAYPPMVPDPYLYIIYYHKLSN